MQTMMSVEPPLPNRRKSFLRWAGILLLAGLIGGVGYVLYRALTQPPAPNSSSFDNTSIALEDFEGNVTVPSNKTLTVNGELRANGPVVLVPQAQPTDPEAGQLYYDVNTNLLAYYNGTSFVTLPGNTVLTIQGQSGDVTFVGGAGIGVTGTTITNTGVTSIGDQTGDILLGSGLEMVGSTLQASGGGGGGGGVTSLNSLTGALTVANATGAGTTVTINDASTAQKGIAQFSGTNFSAAGGTVNTIQDITTASSPTFNGLTLSGDLAVNGGDITSTGALAVGTTGNFALTFETNNTTVATLSGTGAATFQNASNSTSAFQVLNAAASAILNVDTTNSGASVNGNFAFQGFEDVTFPPASPGTWTTGGNVAWSRSTTVFQQGIASAASGTIGNSQTSFLDFDYTFTTDGSLKFYWKVDSEATFDFLYLCVDNDSCIPTSSAYAISGNVDWVQVIVPVNAGAHSFRWVYEKDSVASSGADKGWVDNVRVYDGGTLEATGNLLVGNSLGIGISDPTANLHVAGATTLKAVDVTQGVLQINDDDDSSLFRVDSQFDEVRIGDYLSFDSTATLFVLDTKTSSGDPGSALTNGAMYYNSNAHAFRCYENSVWYDCISRHKIVLGSDVADSSGVCTLTNITGLNFSVVTGRSYRFHATLGFDAAAITTGAQWTASTPTNSFLSLTTTHPTTSTTNTVANINASDGGTCAADTFATTGNLATVEGMITPTASGTVQLRMATEVDTSAITVKAGSTLEWW